MNKVLIVDDNKENRYLLEVLLSSNGFNVITSSNGAEALETAEKEVPDLVVSDILMPVMDGYTLCKKWKTHDWLKNKPFIFYTATYTDPKDEEFALSLGADKFLIKPVDTKDLVNIIVDILNEYKCNKEPVQAYQTNNNTYYQQHNEALIRKLEQKMVQLENSNSILNEEITERKKTEENLRIALDEKKTLLRELYHRIGNSLQLICSLLSKKLRYSPGEMMEEFISDLQNKIAAIALVHQKLYKAKNLTSISLNEYIRELCGSILLKNTSIGNMVSFDYEIEETNVIIETAVPFGLILNELVSNSIKHAFPDHSTGLIKITVQRTEDNYLEFSYSDDGIGLPDDFDPDKDGGMGFSLILPLVQRQLGGEINIIHGKGFECCIRFKFSMIINYE